MKEVINEYGLMILATMISLALVTLILYGRLWNNMTFPQILGLCLSMETDGQLVEDGNQFFYVYQTRHRPSVEGKNCCVYAGEEIGITSLVLAKDYAGRTLIPVLEKSEFVTNAGENNVIVSGQNLIFQKQGIYKLTICAKDDELRDTRVVIQLPVQKRLGG